MRLPQQARREEVRPGGAMEPQTINYADAEVTYAVIEEGDLLQVGGQPTPHHHQ